MSKRNSWQAKAALFVTIYRAEVWLESTICAICEEEDEVSFGTVLGSDALGYVGVDHLPVLMDVLSWIPSGEVRRKMSYDQLASLVARLYIARAGLFGEYVPMW